MADTGIPVDLSVKPDVKGFFDSATNTITYVVKDPGSDACAVVDAVMDIDYAAGRLSYKSADAVIEYIKAANLKLEWLIETHAHADHLSGAPYIQGKLGGKIGIGSDIIKIQEEFGKIFNEGTEFQRDGSQFDRLFIPGFVNYHPGQRIAGLTGIYHDIFYSKVYCGIQIRLFCDDER